MKSGNVKLDSIDVEQEEVHDYGDVAVITGRERVRGSYKGQAFDHTARYSRVWIRREGAWKLALFQETPLPQPGG
jgi:ketosteroid isomerase-like protein